MKHRVTSAAVTLTCAALACGFTLAPGTARADVDLWPLYEKTDDSTTVLYPLYQRDGEFQMIFPFYYRTNEGGDTHLLWPLIKVSEGRIERVAPVWFSDERGEFTLFPLITRDEHATITLLPPAYTAADGSQTTFVPFYSHSLSATSGPRTERLSILWPLWSREIRWNDRGEVVKRTSRALIFTQERSESERTLKVLGIPVRERVE